MPGKGVKARPSKKGRSTSSALLPMKDKAKQQQKKHKMKGSLKRVHVDGQQKNRDVDQREAINLQEQSLRHELVRKLDEEPEPLVKPKLAAPQELQNRGTQLADALDSLQWT